MQNELLIFTDGGSRGNPGPAAAGYVIKTKSGQTVSAKGFFLGTNTNNFAEYKAVILALKEAITHNPEKVSLCSDSQLLVRQLNGQYKVKSPNIKPLYAACMELIEKIPCCCIDHVYREENKHADSLVNKSLDAKSDIVESTGQNKNTTPIRLGVLISGGGTTLLNLLDNIKTGQLNAEIPLVISSRSDTKGVPRTKDAGLNLKIIRKKDYPGIEDFSQALEKELINADIDLVIQAGWLCLWKIPQKFENRVMNIHPALLPSFGGKGMWGHHVHEAVLQKGCKISGCTVHFCTNEYDKGPIIIQRSCPAKDTDTPDTLAERVFQQECIAYPEAIRLFQQGRLKVQGNIVKIR